MTPEPTGGFYRERGVEAFVRQFGYADKRERPDRLNFGGVHRVGERHATTHLTMMLPGYDAARGRITDANGCIALVSDPGEGGGGVGVQRVAGALVAQAHEGGVCRRSAARNRRGNMPTATRCGWRSGRIRCGCCGRCRRARVL